MSSLPKSHFTPEQYLAKERKADFRNEYINGEIQAMAGASREHILLVTNLVRELDTQLLERPCETYSTDMKVKINVAGNYVYPDVVVACGDIRLEDSLGDTLLNPLVIVEVLSPSTELKDRGEKFLQYQWLESLADYVLVSQNKVLVEQFARQPNGHWLYSRLDSREDVLSLTSLGCALPLSRIYHRVKIASE